MKQLNKKDHSHQAGNSNKGYVRHPVLGDGDCGYNAFGITREGALNLLINHIHDVGSLLQPVIYQLLTTQEFYDYLIEQELIQVSFDVVHNQLEAYSRDMNVLKGYINYEVADKKTDQGWVHPVVLQSLAHIQKIEIHMWVLEEVESQRLIPHSRPGHYDYSSYRPTESDQRLDLLFINGNHFERITLIDFDVWHDIGTLDGNGRYPINRSFDFYHSSDDSGELQSTQSNFMPLNPRIPISSVALNEHAELSLWKCTGKLDFARRFLLSSSKIGSLTFLVYGDLFMYWIFKPKNEDLRYTNFYGLLASAICGGFFEPTLSLFPQHNKKYLPIWNGFFQFAENTLLKFFSTSLFFCALEQVPTAKEYHLPSASCLQSHIKIIQGMVVPFLLLSALAAYMEFSKYSISAESNRHLKWFREKCINLDELKYKVIFNAVNGALAMVSIISTINAVATIYYQERVPLIAELVPTALAAIIFGILQYRSATLETRAYKIGYYISEFGRPTLGNALEYVNGVGGVAIMFNIPFTLDDKKVQIAVVAIITVILNLVRAHDAYWYKFIFPSLLYQLQPESKRHLLNDDSEDNCGYGTCLPQENKFPPDSQKTPIDGFEVQNACGNGNCFHSAVVNQFRILKHPFLNSIPKETAPEAALSTILKSQNSSDKDWSALAEIRVLSEQLDCVVAVIDTRCLEDGFISHDVRGSTNEPQQLTTEKTLLRLMFTGSQYLSISKHPALKEGAIRDAFDSTMILTSPLRHLGIFTAESQVKASDLYSSASTNSMTE